MLQDTTFKRRLLSGTFLILSVSLMTGCGVSGRAIGDLTGQERTLPDDDVVDFSNRHTPVLNPSTNRSMAPMEDRGAGMMAPAMAPAPMPQQRASLDSGYAGSATASGRHVPVENQSLIASTAPANRSAPVSNVMASNLPAAAYRPATGTASAAMAPRPTLDLAGGTLAHTGTAPTQAMSEPTFAASASAAKPTLEMPMESASKSDAMASSASPIPGGMKQKVSETTASSAPIETLSPQPAKDAAVSGTSASAPAPAIAATDSGSQADSSVAVAAAGIANAPLEPAASVTAMAEPQKAASHGWFYNMFHKDSAKTTAQAKTDMAPVQADAASAQGSMSASSPPMNAPSSASSVSADAVPAPVAVGDLKLTDSANGAQAQDQAFSRPAAGKDDSKVAAQPVTASESPADTADTAGAKYATAPGDNAKAASLDTPPPMADTNSEESKHAPTLASVPPTPDATPQEQNAAQYNNMVGEHNRSETTREQLMDNSNATVMTSPKNGELVSDAATASPPAATAQDTASAMPGAMQAPASQAAPASQTAMQTSADASVPAAAKTGGEHGWLHNLFHKNPAPSATDTKGISAAGTEAVQEVSMTPGGSVNGTAASASDAANSSSPAAAAAMSDKAAPSGDGTLPVGMALPQPGALSASSAPEGTEVAPHVILGAAPAFPPASDSVSAVSEPPAGASAPMTDTPSTSTVSVSTTPALPAADIVSSPAPTTAETSVQASAGAAMSVPVPGGGTSADAIAARPSLSADKASKDNGASAPLADAMPLEDANAPVAVDPATVSPLAAASDKGNLPDISQISDGKEAPLTLVPPSDRAGSRGLSDSPYAHRGQDAGQGNN